MWKIYSKNLFYYNRRQVKPNTYYLIKIKEKILYKLDPTHTSHQQKKSVEQIQIKKKFVVNF